jgi:hypothetical protein
LSELGAELTFRHYGGEVAEFSSRDRNRFDVRLVPISAAQIQALESLERAFSGLADDFWHEYGVDHDDRIAGGLYRLSSTLEMVIEHWRNASEDVATVEARRRALEAIARNELSGEEARQLASRGLEGQALRR